MTQPVGDGSGPANQGGIPVPLFTQDQVNHFNAEAKRGAVTTYFQELGLDKAPTGDELKAALANAAAYDKLKQGEKGDVERLTTENSTLKTAADKVPGLEAAVRRAELAGDAGLKSKYHKYVEGETEEDIKASIADVLADVGGGGQGGGEGEDGGEESTDEKKPPAKKGTGGTPPAPNPQQGAGGGGAPKASMAAGAEAYKAKHGNKKE